MTTLAEARLRGVRLAMTDAEVAAALATRQRLAALNEAISARHAHAAGASPLDGVAMELHYGECTRCAWCRPAIGVAER